MKKLGLLTTALLLTVSLAMYSGGFSGSFADASEAQKNWIATYLKLSLKNHHPPFLWLK